MKSMEANHDHGNGPLAIVLWIGGILCMATANAQPSELRAWISFGLGATASIISIVVNWDKLTESFKSKRKHKNKDNG